jgi:hypothetical protein
VVCPIQATGHIEAYSKKQLQAVVAVVAGFVDFVVSPILMGRIQVEGCIQVGMRQTMVMDTLFALRSAPVM